MDNNDGREEEIVFRLPLSISRERIKEIRKKRGYTQAKLAKALGLKVTTYASYEQGQRTFPYAIAQKIAHILQVDESDILRSSRGLQPLSKGQSLEPHELIIPDKFGLLRHMAAISASINESFHYYYDGWSIDNIHNIVNRMRDNVMQFSEVSAPLSIYEQIIHQVYAGFLCYFDICSSRVATALITDIQYPDKFKIYIENATTREISLLYHILNFLFDPLKYLGDIHNIFNTHFTLYARQFILNNPDFAFPPLEKMRKELDLDNSP